MKNVLRARGMANNYIPINKLINSAFGDRKARYLLKELHGGSARIDDLMDKILANPERFFKPLWLFESGETKLRKPG